MRPAPGNGAADTPLPDADAAFSRPFGVGGGCCVLAPLLSQLFAISSFRFTFHWPFARLALVRPGLRRFSGRPLRPSGRKPGGLDGRNGLPIPRRSFGTPSNRFFLPMILFGEGFRLHYLYCMISALIDFDQG
ncbi:hypothetical protein ACU8MP_02860 [Rhizobium leguminosarum]|uniref:hypothetical protein n=1 Tax=Rhizobium leguminosarum TaxID=384 RepID=UPI0013EE5B4A|nr:hypothetical protein [Rhizobium leguminosarum]MBB4522183.1 hypothetical protein [Rhizobium leguminosarum]MDH6659874.1 hypothetical protein [Rhizobium sophorae]QIO72636.1 hypothetical protein HA459_11745 [Rhizobium leguminosarum bv. trifolii]QIO79655.1 hypothetical protein HA460_11775 [Rhizobium leguminosarum bv. trifolii]